MARNESDKMTYNFILALMNLLEVDCKVYLKKEDVPLPNFQNNESIAAVFPNEGFIFLDVDVISDIEEFYILLCHSLFEIKFSGSSLDILEKSQLCDAFVYHIMKVVFGLQIDLEQTESFVQSLSKINEQYPESLIFQTLGEFGYEGQELFDNINVDA